MVNAYLLGDSAISLEISDEQFAKIVFGTQLLGEAYAFHQRYLDICVASAELEKRMAEVVFDFNYGLSDSWSDGFSVNKVSIAFISLLNLITSYHDQAKRICGNFGSITIDHGTEIKPLYSAAYDAEFEYRLIEKLRNIVQHGHREIVEVWFNVNRPVLESICQVRTVQLRAKRENLLAHRSFLKARLTNEVESATWNTVDLKWCFRRYVQLVSECHKAAINLVWPRLLEANAMREDIAIKMRAMSGKKSGLCMFKGSQPVSVQPSISIGDTRWFLDRVSVDDLRVPSPSASFSSQSKYDQFEHSAPFLRDG